MAFRCRGPGVEGPQTGNGPSPRQGRALLARSRGRNAIAGFDRTVAAREVGVPEYCRLISEIGGASQSLAAELARAAETGRSGRDDDRT